MTTSRTEGDFAVEKGPTGASSEQSYRESSRKDAAKFILRIIGSISVGGNQIFHYF